MKKKTLTIAIALVLVVALAVGATYAYLKAETGEVKNTFVAGSAVADGDLELFEHVANRNTDGTYTLDTNAKATAGENGVYNSYTVMPGVNLPKDPTVEVTAANGPYYLFVEVTKGAKVDGDTLKYTVDSSKWFRLTSIKDREVYVYAVDGAEATILNDKLNATPVLEAISATDPNTIQVSTDNAKVAALTKDNSALTFQAYACQAAGFQSATEAFNQCFGTTTGA